MYRPKRYDNQPNLISGTGTVTVSVLVDKKRWARCEGACTFVYSTSHMPTVSTFLPLAVGAGDNSSVVGNFIESSWKYSLTTNDGFKFCSFDEDVPSSSNSRVFLPID